MKKNLIEILELKNTMIEQKNLVESFIKRLEQAEERVSMLGDKSITIIQSEEKRKNEKD